MGLLLKLPGPDYEAAVLPFRRQLEVYVDRMERVIADGGPLSRMQVFKDYSVYCRWPIRQLEYSFVLGCLPPESRGRLLDVGSGVTPWPYLMAGRGWPTVSIDPEVDQVVAMTRYGMDAFGTEVDHRVADIRGFGFPDGQFLLVTCISVLEHIVHADVPFAMAEMIRACHPGGRIILTVDVAPNDGTEYPPGQGPFPGAVLERLFSPVARSCGVEDEFQAAVETLLKLRNRDLEDFWSAHWSPGLWEKKNRGYGSLGLVFDLPEEPEKCHELCSRLRETASQMDSPDHDPSRRQVMSIDGSKLWMTDDDVMAQALTDETFEHDIRCFFEHFLRPGDVVFDVGANVGFYTLLFSRCVEDAGTVYAFEPTGQTFGCLVRNMPKSEQNIRLNRMALSQENGPRKLFHAEHGNLCLNSFGAPLRVGSSSAEEPTSEWVWVTKLDDYLRDYGVPSVDLIKIDVEGWEEDVVRGAMRTLLSMAPVLTLEYNSITANNANRSCVALSELIETLGYDLFRYHPATRDLEPVETGRDAWHYSNLIAIKRKRLPEVVDRLKNDPSRVPVVRHESVHAVAKKDLQKAEVEYSPEDILLLLEENRSLRRRIMARMLDDDASKLYQLVVSGNADRTVWLEAINRLSKLLTDNQTDSMLRLEEINRLSKLLTDNQADSMLRLEEINRLSKLLTDSQADSASRQEVINRLSIQLTGSQAESHDKETQLQALRKNFESASALLPLVSIVTPVLNGARWIERCIESIRQQDYPKIEHIIMDGGSTDGTLDICRRYDNLLIVSGKDRGQSHAINKGFAMARGEVLAWLCADDEYELGAVQTAVKGILSGKDVVMGYSRFIDSHGNVTSEHPANMHPHYDHDMFVRFWRFNPISQPSTFWTRKIWEICGPLRENLHFAMDYDLWLRMSRTSRFERVDAYIARYRIHPEAKCFADNYGSRKELIQVSRRYWPPRWNPKRWLLSLQYIFTSSAITQHYADGERLLNDAFHNAENKARFRALWCFVNAHQRHFATPRIPAYFPVLKRILVATGPSWLRRTGSKIRRSLFPRKKVELTVEQAKHSRAGFVLKAEATGYRRPQFRFWAKQGDRFILLRDWGAEKMYVVPDDGGQTLEYGVHVRSGNRGDLADQVWTKINEVKP